MPENIVPISPVQTEQERIQADIINAGFSDATPWRIDLSPYLNQGNETNWNTVGMNSNLIYNAYVISTGAQFAEMHWDIMIPAGRWRFILLHSNDSDRGIITFKVDGRTVGTVDQYFASILYNSIDSFIRPTTTFEKTAKRRIQLSMDSKNASSSNYKGAIQHLTLQRER